ncbi:MAG TPA: outer membrane lipoprotein chaperone LolA, partial [Gammaproteobacteria bacterium]|nr:outer membrane lipoprotein chaperone LolA [Gammaproteobacteria bacterium]
MRARLPLPLLAGLLALASLSAAAAGWDAGRVSDWFSHLDSFHARFSQRVTDADGNPVQTSEGEVWIKRPGRFRWNYERPFEQQVVADGRHLWTYDPELEQATVKPIGEVLGVTPAALLSGVQPFAEMVTVGDGERQGDEVLFR